LVVLSVVDLETKRLPDIVTGPALVVGWIGLVAISILRSSFGSFSLLSIIGGVAALAIALLSFDLRKRREETQRSEAEEDLAAQPKPVRKKGLSLNPIGALLIGLWLFYFIGSFFDGTRYFLAGAASGAAIFGGFFFSMVVLYERGMGLGDAKLGLALGSFTGFLGSPDLVVAGLFFAFVLGGIGGGIHIALGGSRKDAIPFGPFLAAGAALSVFAGNEVIDAYNSLLGA
jgi:prepilin signal peptidase PulO-like enzyme (type II secretory pathway)